MGGCTSNTNGKRNASPSTEVYVTGGQGKFGSPRPPQENIDLEVNELNNNELGSGLTQQQQQQQQTGKNEQKNKGKNDIVVTDSTSSADTQEKRKSSAKSKKKSDTEQRRTPSEAINNPLSAVNIAKRNSSLSTRSITSEVRGSLSRTGSLQELLVSLHEEDADIRNHYSGLDSTARSSILGKGNWGTVKIVQRKRDQRKFACKELALSDKMPNSQIEELKSEIDSLTRLDHPHIARLIETFEEPGKKLYLVMELLQGGELYTQLVEESPLGRFSESRSAALTRRMVSAISYLHGQGIVHRDLKLENFVFRDRAPDSDRLVLIDFGLSKRFGPTSGPARKVSAGRVSSLGARNSSLGVNRNSSLGTNMNTTTLEIAGQEDEQMEVFSSVVGSSYYIAPEVLEGKYSGPLCDIWSLGVIVFMMLCGKAPFNGKNEASIMRKSLTGEYTMTGAVWDTISPVAKDFVKQCLVKNISKRMTAAQALKHEFVTSAILSTTVPAGQRLPPLNSNLVENLILFQEKGEFCRISAQAVAVALTRDDVNEQALAFEILDDDADGYITQENIKDAFERTLKGSEPSLAKISDKSPELSSVESAAVAVFRAMDLDGAGLVRFSQFLAATVDPKAFSDVNSLKEAFTRLDSGRKGVINVKDIQRLYGLNIPGSAIRAKEVLSEFLMIGSDVPLPALSSDDSAEIQVDGTTPKSATTDDKNLKVEFRDFLSAMRSWKTDRNDNASQISQGPRKTQLSWRKNLNL